MDTFFSLIGAVGAIEEGSNGNINRVQKPQGSGVVDLQSPYPTQAPTDSFIYFIYRLLMGLQSSHERLGVGLGSISEKQYKDRGKRW